MDWNMVIEGNREALKRVLAMLVGMAGLGHSAIGSRQSEPAQAVNDPSDCPLPTADCRPTLPRHLKLAIVRLLRPAESAVRRLIIVMARGLVVTLPPPRPRKAKPASIFLSKPGGTGIYLPPGVHMPGSPVCAGGATAPSLPRTPSLPLLDPLRPFRPRPKRPPQSSIPRISFPGLVAPSPITPRRPPGPDDPLDATRLSLRIAALGAALDDLPAQAKRFARWRARKQAGRARRTWPLRPGRAPGQRPANRRRHEVYEVLTNLHWFAFEVLEHRDTS
jgi:hypothetical protein